ncbi:MAG: diacylglycerol kinase family protein [Hyphomicrobiaceae bacterium]
MRIQVIINDRAGTVVGADAEAIAEDVTRILEAAGHDVETATTKPEQLQPALERVRAAQADALVIGGGDGTVRSAAAAVLDTSTALGVLPLGTINRFARDLEIPLDYEAAARTLSRSIIKQVDVAEVNGRVFLCNAILGLTTRFSTERQKLRGKPAADRLVGYFSAARNLLNARRRMPIRIDDGISAMELRVLSLVITNNAYADEASLSMRRPQLDGGALAAYASRHESGWKMAASAVRALLGRLDGDPDVVHLTSPSLTVDVPMRRTVPLSIDGEVEHLEAPLAFTLRPKALRVLTPSPDRDT